MGIPLRYNVRSLVRRWRATLVTVGCIALVVAVFILTQALARGMKETYVSTGDVGNLLVLRKGSTAETNSLISRSAWRALRYRPEIERGAAGWPVASPEVIVLIQLEKRDGQGATNVLFRGVGEEGPGLRSRWRLAAGRMFRPGCRECVVSVRTAGRFQGCGLGESFWTGNVRWTVTGLFDAQKTAYDSEIWGDVQELQDTFDREFYSSILVRCGSVEAGRELAGVLERDRRLKVRVLPEAAYYEEQTRAAGPVQFLGGLLASIMAIGASFAAMNTMYAAVGSRTREIATLRVLGYQRRAILFSFMLESALLALAGGILGLTLSLPLHGLATGTANFFTFSEVAFEFRITPGLLVLGLCFSLMMGALGGILPARLAARRPLLDALRAA
ncbi:MAG: ABC transporter permease [Planctomycetes bacterium]|nr:ABC transporter permease [Planctomycetota bacterium]